MPTMVPVCILVLTFFALSTNARPVSAPTGALPIPSAPVSPGGACNKRYPCVTGSVCLLRRCWDLAPLEAPCGMWRVCQSGLWCRRRRCVKAVSRNRPGDLCRAGGLCTKGFLCHRVGLRRYCMKAVGVNSLCGKEGLFCKEELKCIQGRCRNAVSKSMAGIFGKKIKA